MIETPTVINIVSMPIVPSPTNAISENDFTSRKGELHFFIIWEYGRYKEKEILADIGKNFEILECFDILWSPDKAKENFRRLYGAYDLKHGRRFAKTRGTGRFLLVTVWDANPVYGLAESFCGFEYANTKMLELKKRYRSWNNRKKTNIVHSSGKPEETNLNLTLILGKNTADYLASVKMPWDGSVVKMDQDLLGANGWNSLEEVFYTLNNTVNYVVLRNFEGLPHDFDTSTHADIDILTDNRWQLLSILNQKTSKPFHHRKIVSKVRVGDQVVRWDTRYVGDGYYCPQWEQDMLQDRILSSENVYVLNNEHYFYSLVYHALLHKKTIASDYYVKTERLANSLPLVPQYELFSHIFDCYFDLLGNYMMQKNYVFCSPVHKCLAYNPIMGNLHQTANQLEKKMGLSSVKPIRVVIFPGIKEARQKDSRTYFLGWLNERKVFIKYGGFSGTHKTEFMLCNRLHQLNKDNFPEALFYSNDKNRCVAFDFLEGETLENKIKSADFSFAEREKVILQLKDVAKSLIESGIVHRDVHSGNFIVTKDGKLKLIDFGWAVDSEQYEECRTIRKKPALFLLLGSRQGYCSDDMCSMLKILEEIGYHEKYQEVYRDTEFFLKSHLGKKVIKYKYRHRIMVRDMLRKFEKHLVRPFFNRLKRKAA